MRVRWNRQTSGNPDHTGAHHEFLRLCHTNLSSAEYVQAWPPLASLLTASNAGFHNLSRRQLLCLEWIDRFRAVGPADFEIRDAIALSLPCS
jgi:hypothetical protein